MANCRATIASFGQNGRLRTFKTKSKDLPWSYCSSRTNSGTKRNVSFSWSTISKNVSTTHDGYLTGRIFGRISKEPESACRHFSTFSSLFCISWCQPTILCILQLPRTARRLSLTQIRSQKARLRAAARVGWWRSKMRIAPAVQVIHCSKLQVGAGRASDIAHAFEPDAAAFSITPIHVYSPIMRHDRLDARCGNHSAICAHAYARTGSNEHDMGYLGWRVSVSLDLLFGRFLTFSFPSSWFFAKSTFVHLVR